jgi:D-lactate dehydrogenase (cytochrome)
VGFLPLATDEQAVDITSRLRAASIATRQNGDANGIDVSAIESLDGRSLDLLREDGKDKEYRVRTTAAARAALIFQMELPAGERTEQAVAEMDSPEAQGPMARLCRLLGEAGVLDALEVALPGDERRATQLLAAREAVPVAVNHRVADVQRAGHPGVRKTAADMVVPWPALGEMLAFYRAELERRGLDHAIWGHISDGNLHVNVIPRNEDDVAQGDLAILEFGREVIKRGGSPLAEHGAGRNPQKQELLRMLYGEEGLAAMRAVKSALDPEGKLAPGVLWPVSA